MGKLIYDLKDWNTLEHVFQFCRQKFVKNDATSGL